MHSKELLKGTLKTIILKLLKENERMYGYEITQEVKKMTDGKIQLTEGALYPTLHRLEADGYLKTETQKIGKRIRKYYYLTSKGGATSGQLVNEFYDFINTINLLLKPQ
ncbi:MAG TPA: PadR family transcriptional regulator [Cyclobacteriaceae bacterium]